MNSISLNYFSLTDGKKRIRDFATSCVDMILDTTRAHATYKFIIGSLFIWVINNNCFCFDGHFSKAIKVLYKKNDGYNGPDVEELQCEEVHLNELVDYFNAQAQKLAPAYRQLNGFEVAILPVQA
jgi:hypothetical protein